MSDDKIVIDVPGIEVQNSMGIEIDKKIEQASKHIACEVVGKMKTGIMPSWREFGDPLYERPAAEEVNEVIEDILAYKVTKAELANKIGVSKKNNRAINLMIKGGSWPSYAQWRLMLILSGRITMLMVPGPRSRQD